MSSDTTNVRSVSAPIPSAAAHPPISNIQRTSQRDLARQTEPQSSVAVAEVWKKIDEIAAMKGLPDLIKNYAHFYFNRIAQEKIDGANIQRMDANRYAYITLNMACMVTRFPVNPKYILPANAQSEMLNRLNALTALYLSKLNVQMEPEGKRVWTQDQRDKPRILHNEAVKALERAQKSAGQKPPQPNIKTAWSQQNTSSMVTRPAVPKTVNKNIQTNDWTRARIATISDSIRIQGIQTEKKRLAQAQVRAEALRLYKRLTDEHSGRINSQGRKISSRAKAEEREMATKDNYYASYAVVALACGIVGLPSALRYIVEPGNPEYSRTVKMSGQYAQYYMLRYDLKIQPESVIALVEIFAQLANIQLEVRIIAERALKAIAKFGDEMVAAAILCIEVMKKERYPEPERKIREVAERLDMDPQRIRNTYFYLQRTA